MALQVPFNDLKAQYLSIKPSIDAAIAAVVDSVAFVGGKEIAAFEREFEQFCGGGHGVAVGNGTDAIFLALHALGIGAGDEVITVSHTFIATVEPVLWLGARPVFVDIRDDTCNIDPERIEAAITPRTRAIIAVDLYGQPADMDPIVEIARRRGLKVIEDAAQAAGARYKGRRAGLLGDIATFSFYPGKNLGAYGDGGFVLTGDPELALKVRLLHDHGRDRGQKYEHAIVGLNSRLDTLQAAILRCKLPHLDRWNERRRTIAAHYTDRLRNVVGTPVDLPDTESIHHLYVVRSPRRDILQARLKERGVGTGLHYPVPVHRQPPIVALDLGKNALPVTDMVAKSILSLPIYAEMTDAQVEYVCDAVRQTAVL